ncbi:hypothetical protein [Nocardiopsis salina]|uniref:hypothetical protein n=1 Tax=Nocardiopsis salina TaxID=245836 RepID=UPI000349D636|nr:hypothetical protein [Nocardiopsis salina]
MASASEAQNPSMSWEGIEEALNRVRGELARISLQSADLDRNVAQRMLQCADPVGLTRERWVRAERSIHRLWTLYAAFEDVVEQACELHGSGGEETSVRESLSRVLTGPSLVLPLPPGPSEHSGPFDGDTEHLSLAEAVARMSSYHDEAARVVAEAESAWEVLHPRLGGLEALWQEIGSLAGMVGGDEEDHEPLRAELAVLGGTVRRDPLSLVSEDGTVDTSDLERARLRFERTAGELRDALRMRDFYDESAERLAWAIDDAEEKAGRTASLRRRVAEAVAVPAPIEVPDAVPLLRSGLADMAALRDRGRWRELGTLHGRLQQAVHETVDDLTEREESLQELLDRRDELRGRLDGCRARAVRLGLSEDERLLTEERRAHRALWHVPGDLREAGAALAAYREALGQVAGTGCGSNRTTPGAGASEGRE